MRQGHVSYLLAGAFHRMAFVEWGPADGAPVLCVHGLTRSGRDFDVLAQALAGQGRRVICPDLPGRGASDWLPDPMLYQPPSYVVALSHLLARLDGPVDWVGTSLGAICGMRIAAAKGHPIRRMVMNDLGPFVPQAAMARIRDYMATTPRFPDLAALEAHLRRVHAPFGALTDAQWRHLAETSARPAEDGGVLLHYDPAIATPILAQEAQALDMHFLWNALDLPILAIRGAESDLLLAETAEAMAAKHGVRLAVIPGAGHAPALMDAAQVALVAGFLAEG
ncbi:alpha/beta fold hydrolase [Falsiroseomonas ponticola]|uniref:alpha/beta fold hydrolase n=1 Tax=Falsiroseomonas ponticola TaxID=2786951 RepID=UPI001933BE10|nr:alpha/beta fold hydrolase [Roseomonas ponticola]